MFRRKRNRPSLQELERRSQEMERSVGLGDVGLGVSRATLARQLLREGLSVSEVSKSTGVSPNYLYRLKKQQMESGNA